MYFAKHHQHHRDLIQYSECDYTTVVDNLARVFETQHSAFSDLIIPE